MVANENFVETADKGLFSFYFFCGINTGTQLIWLRSLVLIKLLLVIYKPEMYQPCVLGIKFIKFI